MSDTEEAAAARRPSKRASAFRTIGEVAEDLDLPAHVLRFWETKFPQLKPLKRGGGRRYYRPEDIVLLRRIRQCLYQDGYTIRGVQKLLGEGGPDAEFEAEPEMPPAAAGPATLFPLEPVAADAAADRAAKPVKSASPRHLSPDARAALEELRVELVEIRELVRRLGARDGAS